MPASNYLAHARHLAATVGRYNLAHAGLGGDIESITDRYAHGDCHALTAALLGQAESPCALVRLTADRTPIHSCVPIGLDPQSQAPLYFDAYGLVTWADIEWRYGHMGELRLDLQASTSDLFVLCELTEDDLTEAALALEILLHTLSLPKQAD